MRWLLKRSERAGRDLLKRASLILVVDAILLSSLTWLLAGSPRLVGVGNLVIRLVFSLGAVFAAALLVTSLVLTLRSLFFLHREKETPLFNLDDRSPAFSSIQKFQEEFTKTPRSRFTEQMLTQVQIESQNRARQGRLFRWGALFLLVALFPYLLAVIFEVFLLFL